MSFLAVAPCAAQQTTNETARAEMANEIRALVEQMQSVREQVRRQDVAHRERVEILTRQINTLREQVESQEAAVADRQMEVTTLKAEISSREDQQQRASARLKSVAGAAIPVAEQIRMRIENNPGDQRLRRVTAINEASAMLRDDTSPATRLEGLRALFSALGEEWIAAQSVVLSNEPVVLDGGARLEHGWVLKFGSASKIFASEDGDTVGIWSGDAENPWQLDLPAKTEEQIRLMMAVVREKSPPAVVPLPVLVRPTSER